MSYLEYQLTADGSTILLTTIANPKGGVYTSEDNETGAIVIAFPASWAGNMSKLKIDVSQLTDNLSFALSCTGEAPDTTWQNCSAQIIGDKSSNNRVRFGYSGAGCRAGEPARPVIVIGDITSTWTSPKVVISNFAEHGRDYDIGHINIDWDIQILDDLTGYVFDVDIPDALLDAKGIINQGDLATKNEADANVLNMTNAPAEAGADKTANQFAQSLGSIDFATVNFNGRNDRDNSAITVPEIATDGTAIDHTINTDGSADISFEWSWAGTESDIDGFVVYVRGSTSSSSYDFGTTPSEEITFYCRPDRRHFTLKGVAANLYWTFGVSAYRVVDPDVNANGFIATAVIQPSASGEDPYQPSANVAFAGNITGTVNDQSVSSVVYHDGTVIRRTDGTGVDADSLPESTARKWAGETGADVTPPLPPDENLIGYWSFDEGQGLIARDSSGNNNTGTLNGGPEWIDGVAGKALNFDGSDDYVSIPTTGLWTDTVSICFWMNVSTAVNNQCAMGCHGGSNYAEVMLENSSFPQSIRISLGGEDNKQWSNKINNGLVFISIVGIDTTELHLYINEVEQGDIGAIEVDGTGIEQFDIGASRGGNLFFNGIIDEVRIYNIALTPSQIKALFLNPGGTKAPIPGADKTGDHSADVDALQTTNAPAEANADVTNYADTRVANAILDSDCLTVAKPIGGAYSSTGNPDTGAIVVHLPQGYTATMMSFFIDVYNWQSNISFSIFVSGYNYSTDSVWKNTTANLLGSTAADNRVRFGNDGSKCCVIIGDTDSDWYYPKVTVHGFRAGYSNYSVAQWETGWDVTIESDLSGYTTDVDYSDALIDANTIKNQGDLATTNEADADVLNMTNAPAEASADKTSNNPQPPDWLSALINTQHIADSAITNAKIHDLDAAKVTTGTLSADRIAASSITADKISVDNLSAVSTTTGSITTESGDVIDIYGDLRLQDGTDIYFLCGGSTQGTIYSTDDGLIITSSNNQKTIISGVPLKLESYGGIICVDNIVPVSNNNYSCGTSDYKLSDVWTVNQHTGDVLFSDTHCPICGECFKKGDMLALKVVKYIKGKNKSKDEIDCVPVHMQCVGGLNV